jgi:superfamily II DNA helicase RecQ
MAAHSWSIEDIRNLVQRKFEKRPCWVQVQIARKDVIGCAATGSGKTLSFWIPLLMALEEGLDKMTIVVTPLNLLGKQNVQLLEKAGLSAVAVSRENANPETFRVKSRCKHSRLY